MATFMKVPRIIISMCDDLCVKCPFAGQGCEEIIQRGHVQAHVDKYCDYRLLRCPDANCNYMTRKKDLDPDRRCLHELRSCDNCEESVMERDFEVGVVQEELITFAYDFPADALNLIGSYQRTVFKLED